MYMEGKHLVFVEAEVFLTGILQLPVNNEGARNHHHGYHKLENHQRLAKQDAGCQVAHLTFESGNGFEARKEKCRVAATDSARDKHKDGYRCQRCGSTETPDR